MWFSSWTGFSRGNASCLRYRFWLAGFPGWDFQSHLGNLHVHTCTMNLSRNCHLNPMSRCEILFFIPLFSHTLYLLHLLSVSLLFCSFFSLFLFPLRLLTFHSLLIFFLSLSFSPIATSFFCVFDFPLSPDALSLSLSLPVITPLYHQSALSGQLPQIQKLNQLSCSQYDL